MIDACHIKVHLDGTGAQGGNQDMGRTKGGEELQRAMLKIPNHYLLQYIIY